MFELHIFEMKKLKTPFRKYGILTNVLSPYFLASLRHSYVTKYDKTTDTIKKNLSSLIQKLGGPCPPVQTLYHMNIFFACKD